MGRGDRQPDHPARWVKDAGEVLKGQTDQYIFISTISVYGDFRSPPDESTAVAKWDRSDDPLSHREMSRELGQYYGALKALSGRRPRSGSPARSR
ncbi:MAG: hypothetical protein R2909_16155 [Gemmatimonadales bacterium]